MFILLLIGGLKTSYLYGQFPDSLLLKQSFTGKIIRSFAVSQFNENHLVVGLKGNSGDAKIHFSDDLGDSWKPLNQDRPLCDSCEDIQAVAFISEDILIAGTWKHGLFRSINEGQHFEKLKNFPSNDIRSIQINDEDNVYAASATHGIQLSKDKGLTWTNAFEDTVSGKFPAWHIDIDPRNDSVMYGMSFKQQLMRSTDSGKNWTVTYQKKGVMCWDIAFAKNGLIYVAGSSDSLSYIIYSFDNGETWQAAEIDIPAACAIEVKENLNLHEVIVGSWDSGYQQYYPLYYDILEIEFLEDESIPLDTIGLAKMFTNRDYFINFSWGNGVKKYKIQRECEIYIPHIATLDVDCYQCFEIYSSCPLSNIDFNLYDRFGNLKYQSKGSLEEINHFFNNLALGFEDGTYSYTFSGIRGAPAKPFSIKGHITILK
jgi:photosystem II stability/assembly factor-like uncharacterized protein